MLPYINSRLVMWSEWCRRKEDGGLGYPKECSYTRLQARAGGAGYMPNVNADCWEIEQAVGMLKTDAPHLHLVVDLFYRKTMTGEQMARKCGCHRDTLYVKLHQAHVAIMNHLHDMPVKKSVDITPTVHV